jgi:hypothetical protein
VGIVREMTRDLNSRQRGPEIIHGDQVITAGRGEFMVRCPLLNRDDEYATFGGNGIRRGRGYQVVGRRFGGWLMRAGYEPSTDDGPNPILPMVKSFLKDLAGLARDLDLTICGYNPGDRFHPWKGMDDLQYCLKSRRGREWLDEAVLRIYAPGGFLQLWRSFFARRLGYAWIPRAIGDCGPISHDAESLPAYSGAAVRKWLKQQRLNQDDLAFIVGKEWGRKVSRRFINDVINGRRHSEEFGKVFALLREKE